MHIEQTTAMLRAERDMAEAQATAWAELARGLRQWIAIYAQLLGDPSADQPEEVLMHIRDLLAERDTLRARTADLEAGHADV